MGRILELFSLESSLVAALKEADPKAQRRAYEKYSGRMFGVCLRYVDDYMAAEDVMIKGFLKVFEKIGQFKGEGSFEGWIRKIIVNEALGHLRQNRNSFLQVDMAETAYEAAQAHSFVEESLGAEDLLKMIESLPAGYRTVFNLYAIEGYAHNEIADMLGISESTSKSQLHRARAQLQRLVLNAEGDLKKKMTV